MNVVGTANLLEAVRRDAPAATLVFASTGGAIYGEGEGRELPFPEEAPLAPEAPYGQSKLAGEGYVGYYRRMHGLNAVEPAPRQRLRAAPGSARRGRGGRDLLRAAPRRRPAHRLRRRPADPGLRLRRRRRRRDAHRRGAAAGGADGLGEVYNVGTGRETNVLELVEALASIGDRDDFQPEMAPARAGEIQRCAIDPGKAGADLGWQAATGVKEGLRITLESV